MKGQRTSRSLWGVILFAAFSLTGLVQQTALLEAIQSPRMQAIGNILLDQVLQTRTMDSRIPLATLVGEVWLAGQDIEWLRIEIDDGKMPVSRGSSAIFEALPKAWRNECQGAVQFETRRDFDRSTMMAGAPPVDGAPGFCVFVGYKSALATNALRWVAGPMTWVFVLAATIVFVAWRTVSPGIAVPTTVVAVLVVALLGHFAIRELVLHHTQAEADKAARLAAVDFKIALQGAPIHALESAGLVRDSLREFLVRDPLALGVGMRVGDFEYWQWRAEQPDGKITYGREAFRSADVQVFAALPGMMASSHAATLALLLTVGAWAGSRFLVDATFQSGARRDVAQRTSPLVGAAFFFVITEELLRPALLLALQQHVSGISQSASLWLGLNVFWVCALWGTWTSCVWFRYFSKVKILSVSAAVLALSLLGQGVVTDAWHWLPVRGIGGYAFGLAFQSAVVYAARLNAAPHRFDLSAGLAQGALVAMVLGPLFGGAVTRIGGPTWSFVFAAFAAAACACCASRVAADVPDRSARSALDLLLAPGTGGQTIPLVTMGIANRFAWFAAVGLLLPTVAGSEPLGAVAVGELTGSFGIGMYIGRRYADRCYCLAMPANAGWIANATGALAVALGYATLTETSAWLLVAFISGVALAIGSRAQQDWIFRQPRADIASMCAASRLADRGGCVLASIVVPPLYCLPSLLASLIFLSVITLLWFLSFAFSGVRAPRSAL